MDVVAMIGQRLYHALGSACHRTLEAAQEGPLLVITDAMAHENGMEPCGACLGAQDVERSS